MIKKHYTDRSQELKNLTKSIIKEFGEKEGTSLILQGLTNIGFKNVPVGK
jgi:hypothetical protein